MKAIKIILAAVAVAALTIFASSCSKHGDSSVKITYALSSFTFDNGTASDATALKAELESYCKGCTDKTSAEVKSGAQNIVNKYTSGKSFSYEIKITAYKNGTSTGFIVLRETLK